MPVRDWIVGWHHTARCSAPTEPPSGPKRLYQEALAVVMCGEIGMVTYPRALNKGGERKGRGGAPRQAHVESGRCDGAQLQQALHGSGIPCVR